MSKIQGTSTSSELTPKSVIKNYDFYLRKVLKLTNLHLWCMHGRGDELIDNETDVDGNDHEAIDARECAGQRVKC